MPEIEVDLRKKSTSQVNWITSQSAICYHKIPLQNINHNDFRRISTQVKLINDDSIKNINRLKLYRVKL